MELMSKAISPQNPITEVFISVGIGDVSLIQKSCARKRGERRQRVVEFALERV